MRVARPPKQVVDGSLFTVRSERVVAGSAVDAGDEEVVGRVQLHLPGKESLPQSIRYVVPDRRHEHPVARAPWNSLQWIKMSRHISAAAKRRPEAQGRKEVGGRAGIASGPS